MEGATAVVATAVVANSRGMPQLNLICYFVNHVNPSLLLAGTPGWTPSLRQLPSDHF